MRLFWVSGYNAIVDTSTPTYTYVFASKPLHVVSFHSSNIPPLGLLFLAKSSFNLKKKKSKSKIEHSIVLPVPTEEL